MSILSVENRAGGLRPTSATTEPRFLLRFRRPHPLGPERASGPRTFSLIVQFGTRLKFSGRVMFALARRLRFHRCVAV